MLGQTSGVSFPYTKTKPFVLIHVCQHFRYNPPHSPDLSPVQFYLGGRLKTLVYSSQIENEEDSTNSFFMPVSRFAASLGPL